MNPALMNLPGADLIAQGLKDLEKSLLTIPALLVCIGKPRLESAGLSIPHHPEKFLEEPELMLYALLIKEEQYADPYSYYNSLLRRLISFGQALCSFRLGGNTLFRTHR